MAEIKRTTPAPAKAPDKTPEKAPEPKVVIKEVVKEVVKYVDHVDLTPEEQAKKRNP